ncbi:hypothetical protein BLNAU_8513 [Blattamonas nauphoetae]|uniref:Uncharacterized protein n=1 Tax=Blattamonas nauphoetae TaxID=2049346 RepID=A0ABQ9XYB1_9EUKA|nr:hypothetical protein BLNAU_8513 [Blattamonas nauphoetae]
MTMHPDVSLFLNWNERPIGSKYAQALVFRSLIAHMNFQPVLDDSLAAKSVKLLDSVIPENEQSTNIFLRSLSSSSDDYFTEFINSMILLVSSTSQSITVAAIKILDILVTHSSPQVRFSLVKADLVPQLITTLNFQSVLFTEAADIHVHLLKILHSFIWISTPDTLKNTHDNEQKAVHETVLTQVLVPSEKYIWHLCVNRYSIIHGGLASDFMIFLDALLQVSPYYQPTMDFVLDMPVVLTIPSCLAFIEADRTIWTFLHELVEPQREWNRRGGNERPMWNEVLRMLRTEGIEDVIEQKLKTDKQRYAFYNIVADANQAGLSEHLSHLVTGFGPHTLFVSDLSSPEFPLSQDVFPFQNWNGRLRSSKYVPAVLFGSLIANLKLQPALDASLEAKAVKFIDSIKSEDPSTVDSFLTSLGQTTDESLATFVQSVGVLISSTSQIITTAAMTMLQNIVLGCSHQIHHALIKTDLITNLVAPLTSFSVSSTEAENIHVNLMKILRHSLWFSTPDALTQLESKDDNEQQAIHGTVLTQVVVPSEPYIYHLCVNRCSNMEGRMPDELVDLLSQLLRIFLCYQPTMDLVLNMPVIFTISSLLAIFEEDYSNCNCMFATIRHQREWNEKGGKTQQLGKKVHQMLRMEGVEDLFETKLQNDQKELEGGFIVSYSVEWSNLQGKNLPGQE